MDSNTIRILLSVMGAEAVTGALDHIGHKAEELGGSLVRLAGVALTLDAAFEGLKGALELGGELVNLSARTGESIQNLTLLTRAFQMAGMGAEQLGGMINRMQRVLQMDTAPMQAALAQLGLSADGLKGLGAEDQLRLLGAGFQTIEDPAKRSALAMEVFGRSGGQMLKLLTESKVLDEAAEDAGRFGARMRDLAPKFEQAEERLALMKMRLAEMWSVALEKLLPALNKIGEVIKGLNLAPLGGALGAAILPAAAALGLNLAGGLVAKLETSVALWAGSTMAGSAFAGSFLMPLTNGLAKLFSVFLPPLIIVAIAAAIISAITEGITQYALDRQQAADAPKAKLAADLHKTSVATAAPTNAVEWGERHAVNVKELEEQTKILRVMEEQKISTEAALASKHLRGDYSVSAPFDEAGLTNQRARVAGLSAITAAPLVPQNLEAAAQKKTNTGLEEQALTIKTLRVDAEKASFELLTNEQQLNELLVKREELESKVYTGTTKEVNEAETLKVSTERDTLTVQINAKQKTVDEAKDKLVSLGAGAARASVAAQGDDSPAMQRELKVLELTAKKIQLGKEYMATQQVTQAQADARATQEVADLQTVFDRGQRVKADAGKDQLAGLDSGAAQTAVAARGDDSPAMQREIKVIELTTRRIQLAKEYMATGQVSQAQADAQAEQEVTDLQTVFDRAQTVTAAAKADGDDEKSLRRELLVLQYEEQDLQNDTSKTDEEKWAVKRANLSRQLALYETYLTKLRAENALEQNPVVKEVRQARIEAGEGQQKGVHGAAGAMDAGHTSVGQGVGSGMTEWVNQVGTAGRQVANLMKSTIGNAVSGITDGIYGWITGTKSFGSAMLELGNTVLRSVLNTIVQIGVQQVVNSTVGKAIAVGWAALTGGLKAADTASTVAAEGVKTPVLATNAALASAGSFGTAAIIGIAALALAIGAFIGGGFAEGGYTGDGAANQVAGSVHKGEFVFSAPAVKAIGASNLSAMHASASGQASRPSPVAAPGTSPVGGSGGVNMAFFNTQQNAQQWLSSQSGRRTMLDFLRQSQYEL